MTDKDITICGHGSATPSTKNMNTFCTSRYNKVAKNGVHKGLVCVRRPKKITDALRTKFHGTYKTILGRNIYDQNKRKYVYTKYTDGKYYSDCSSSYCATLNKIGIKMDLLNTAGIYYSDLFEDVPVKMKDGHVTNPEILKVGDALLFAGDDPKRPKQIGHVEMVYEIKIVTPDKKEKRVEITCGSLFVRAGASKEYKAIGVVYKGEKYTVTKESDGWGYIPAKKGWISLNSKYSKEI